MFVGILIDVPLQYTAKIKTFCLKRSSFFCEDSKDFSKAVSKFASASPFSLLRLDLRLPNVPRTGSFYQHASSQEFRPFADRSYQKQSSSTNPSYTHHHTQFACHLCPTLDLGVSFVFSCCATFCGLYDEAILTTPTDDVRCRLPEHHKPGGARRY
jgi:hypothetical protein